MQAKLIAYIIGAALLIAGLFFGYRTVKGHFDEFAELKSFKESAQQVSQGTEGAIAATEAKVAEVNKVEVVINDRRSEAERDFEGLKNENASVAAWAAMPIPAELREQERARRAAIDGPANAGAGSEAAGAAPTP